MHLIREEVAVTRADLARVTGLARSTVAQRVDTLLATGLVVDAGGSVSTGGRPPAVLAFNRDAGVVLVGDLGATHARVAVSDLVGAPLAERAADLDIALGPESVLAWLAERFAELLEEVGRSGDDVRGIGVGVPGPVEFDSGRPVNPPIMPGWDDFPIPEWFADRYSAPVLVDNDVNIMARGEHRTHWRETEHLLLIKVGHGDRLRDRGGRAHPPRRAGSRRRHRPHPRNEQRGRRLPLREHRLPGSDRRWAGSRRAARRPGRGRRTQPRRGPARPERPSRRDQDGA